MKLRSLAGLLSIGVAAFSASAFPIGADVILRHVDDVSTHGPVGATVAYSMGSHTCNIGTQNLTWAGNGTPAFGMNMYRLNNGRLMQVGLSFAKTACCAGAQTNVMCSPTCNGVGGSQLGVGCLDVYWATYNAGQSRLAPRSAINPWTGAFTAFSTASGDAIFKRLQVPTAQITGFPGSLWFMEGVYVGTDDAGGAKRNNNASYHRVTMSGTTLALTGSTQFTQPGIKAWRANGLGAGVADPSVVDGVFDVPNEGRFHTAYKVTPLGGGQFRYDYAVFNLCSDRAGGSISIPVPSGVVVTNAGFNAPLYHSGEVYSNTAWTYARTANAVVWSSPQTFAQNPNTNALRWGTMYNFWFEANQAPTTANATLGLFKPHTPQAVDFAVQGPSAPPCDGDVNCDGNLNGFDVLTQELATGGDMTDYCQADADYNHDGNLDGFDVEAVVVVVGGGACP